MFLKNQRCQSRSTNNKIFREWSTGWKNQYTHIFHKLSSDVRKSHFILTYLRWKELLSRSTPMTLCSRRSDPSIGLQCQVSSCPIWRALYLWIEKRRPCRILYDFKTTIAIGSHQGFVCAILFKPFIFWWFSRVRIAIQLHISIHFLPDVCCMEVSQHSRHYVLDSLSATFL